MTIKEQVLALIDERISHFPDSIWKYDPNKLIINELEYLKQKIKELKDAS